MGGEASVKAVVPDDCPPDIILYGFPNLGNTCYCNVILQSFFASPSVRAHLRDLPNDRQPLSSTPLATLLLLLSQGSQPTQTRVCRLDPSSFLRSVYRTTNRFPGGYQHDSQEFLLFLVDSFDDTIRELGLPSFSSILQGTRVWCFKCSACGKQTDRSDFFSCLQLSMPTDRRECLDLQDLVDNNLSPELIEDDWVCDVCRDKHCGRVFTYLSRVPQLVVVHLVRFGFNRQTGKMHKNFEPVDIAETLRVNSGNGPATYRVVSVVVHCGISIDEGHFMALIKIGRHWMLASDDRLVRMTGEQVAAAVTTATPQKRLVPYLLFYERVQEEQ
jgi:ubiquitin C-terminal hydrolase